MAISVTTNYSATGYSPLSVTNSGNVSVEINEVIPASTANVAIESVIFNFGSLQQAILYASGGNLTLKTNNATTPNQTFTMLANQPLVWNYGSPITNPFTANVTAGFFATNAETANVTLIGTLTFN
jgi:hypothetical protein